MKVNMTPNPLDVVTIHASQGDTEARQWGFELHNNGELIDTSDITEQLFFKAYKGGTEQLLPENGSTPTTSPFIGDIRYPQGLLTDQEFTYRQSPTEEDGLAKITDIKGNTLVWNQLIQNGNFADTSKWSAESGATLSISNNIATISSTTANNGIKQYFSNPLTVNHKYLIKAEFNVPTEYRCVIGTGSAQGVQIEKLISTANTWTEVSGIGTCTSSTTAFYCFVRGTTYENVKIRNVMCFDITAMGLDISSPSDFTSLFSLPYYAYNQGTLLSFMGNGIKTTGKNQIVNIVKGYFNAQSSTITVSDGGESFVFYAMQGKTYYASSSIALNRNVIAQCDTPNLVNGSPIYNPINFGNGTETKWTATWEGWTVWYVYNVGNDNVENSAQVEIGTTATAYEPYTSSTLSLPISTYFPNGMKSAGSVYDELTPAKAITRIGAVDLGTLEWTDRSSVASGLYSVTDNTVLYAFKQSVKAVCAKYPYYGTVVSAAQASGMSDKTIALYYNMTGSNHIIYLLDTSYSDVASLKSALSGVYLYYELATPTETSFTTASLVTENAEIPLSNNDGVLVGKCTEQLSSKSGFFDAKIKLADEDGECYSNKIQLHVERSPQ